MLQLAPGYTIPRMGDYIEPFTFAAQKTDLRVVWEFFEANKDL